MLKILDALYSRQAFRPGNLPWWTALEAMARLGWPPK
jgi:hypothetical protein